MNAESYIALYYFALLVFVLVLQSFGRKPFLWWRPLLKNSDWCILLLLFVFCHITFRSLDELFGDTVRYADFFEQLVEDGFPEESKDVGFTWVSYICSLFMSVTVWFGTIALIYLLPPYFAFKRHFPKHYFWALVMFVTSFSFWGYAVNGLRNGLSTSLLIAGMFASARLLDSVPCRRKLKFFDQFIAWRGSIIIFLLAIGFHKTALLPVGAFVLARFYKNTKVYLVGWGVAILLSLSVGGVLEGCFSELSIFGVDDRLSGYLANKDSVDSELFHRTGFRWDFILYSTVPIVLGWLYIYRYKFRDPFYIQLFNTYLVCNAFWVLLIRAAFSNRFAYLSWFLLPVVMIYPLLRANLVKRQSQWITLMVLFSYLFTFLMYLRSLV